MRPPVNRRPGSFGTAGSTPTASHAKARAPSRVATPSPCLDTSFQTARDKLSARVPSRKPGSFAAQPGSIVDSPGSFATAPGSFAAESGETSRSMRHKQS